MRRGQRHFLLCISGTRTIRLAAYFRRRHIGSPWPGPLGSMSLSLQYVNQRRWVASAKTARKIGIKPHFYPVKLFPFHERTRYNVPKSHQSDERSQNTFPTFRGLTALSG